MAGLPSRLLLPGEDEPALGASLLFSVDAVLFWLEGLGGSTAFVDGPCPFFVDCGLFLALPCTFFRRRTTFLLALATGAWLQRVPGGGDVLVDSDAVSLNVWSMSATAGPIARGTVVDRRRSARSGPSAGEPSDLMPTDGWNRRLHVPPGSIGCPSAAACKCRLMERAEDDPLEHQEQVTRAQDHAGGCQHGRPRARPKVPTRIGNSPTNPFRPGTAAEPRAARIKKNARSGSRFQSPPILSISRVWYRS